MACLRCVLCFCCFLFACCKEALSFVVNFRGERPYLNHRLSAQEQVDGTSQSTATNVLGTELCPCCTDVGGSGIGTGFYRDGFCATGDMDLGRHTVCVQVTDKFLRFSSSVGNDLSTPVPQFMFPGLKDGDIWCLCAQRWAQAYEAGVAPKLFLKSTHEKTLDYAPLEILQEYALDNDEALDIMERLSRQRERFNKLL